MQAPHGESTHVIDEAGGAVWAVIVRVTPRCQLQVSETYLPRSLNRWLAPSSDLRSAAAAPPSMGHGRSRWQPMLPVVRGDRVRADQHRHVADRGHGGVSGADGGRGHDRADYGDDRGAVRRYRNLHGDGDKPGIENRDGRARRRLCARGPGSTILFNTGVNFTYSFRSP